MKKASVLILAASVLALTGPLATNSARAADEPAAAGFWITPDHGAVVHIEPCDSGLCGNLVGLRTDNKSGEVPKDSHNPDPAKRDTPRCGMTLMGSLKPVQDRPAKWEGGWVYDPESGSTYTAEMQLDGPDTLKLRGYIGISLFGRSQVWTREAGDHKNRCTVPAAG